VDADVTREATRIRSETGMRLPDAIHVATAIVAGADAFLTNDARLNHPRAGLPVLVLDDLIRGV
jgi:predicted nucleic acid-binding protein